MLSESAQLLHSTLAADPRGRVLLIQPGALGDSLLSLAVADQLLRAHSALAVEMLGHLDYIRLFPNRSPVTAVSDIDIAPLHLLFAEPPGELPLAFADYLRRFSAVVTWLGQADGPFCRNLSTVIDGPVLFVDRGPPAEYPHHVVHYWLSQLFDVPPSADCWTYQLRLSRQDISTANRQLVKLLDFSLDQTNYLVFHPGAGALQKCWPIECFVQIAQLITKSTDSRIVYLLGPAEQERFSPSSLDLLRTAGQVLLSPDITVSAGLISRSCAFLGHDSGPTHLAAALGVPTLAIFGPTNPTHWRPLGPAAQLIHSANQSLLASDSPAIDSVYSTLLPMVDL